MASTKYSISAVNRITGKSRTTITKHIKQGKLSCEKDANGNKVVDAAELIRVYGDACDFEREEGARRDPTTSRSSLADPSVQQLLHSVQQQLDMVIKERERERRHFEQQVEQLQDSLKLAQEGQKKAMLLLEHRSGVGEWQKAVKSLEERIANQEVSAKEQLVRLKETAKRDAIEEIKNKPWWRVVFG